LLSCTILLLKGSRPLNAISFVFCADIVKQCSVIIRFNLYAAYCKLSPALDITWSSANNSIKSCWFLKSGIPVMSYFCHLVVISSKYIYLFICTYLWNQMYCGEQENIKRP